MAGPIASRNNAYPHLRSGYTIAPAEAGSWQVRWNFDEIAFLDGEIWGRILTWLLPRLDGKHTLAELEQAARDHDSLKEFSDVLTELDNQGFLVWDQSQTRSGESSAVLSALENTVENAEEVLARVRSTPIDIYGNSVLARQLVQSISRQEFPVRQISEWSGRFCSEGETPPFPVVVETDWKPDELDAINKHALAICQSWMLLGAWNSRILVGPIFVPGETACYACYRKRLDSHRRFREAHQILDEWKSSDSFVLNPEPVFPSIAELAAAWTVQELFAHLSGVSPARTVGRVLVYLPQTTSLNTETVLRYPWCPQCSSDQQ